CTGLTKENGHVQGVEIIDDETGEIAVVRARCVINATGVFVDRLRQLDRPGAPNLVSPSQGVHLVLPRSFLPGDAAIMIPKTDDGRVLFAVPWHDRVILGTTDTAVESPDLEPRPLPEEIEFLLKHAARYLTRDPTAADVLSAFAGLRPLVAAQDDEDTASLSRDHTIEVAASGLITITGGKWTTYRRMAEDAVDQAQWVAGLNAAPCVTESLRLHGATAEVSTDVFGSDRAAIAELEKSLVDGALVATAAVSITRGEVAWFAREEMARSVEDVLARRTRWLLRDARASIAAAPMIARWLSEELGRDSAWVAAQESAYATLAVGYLLTSEIANHE
ncbi:MAG: FAD-dependent oxidoreductase, partial [Verrucomicrobiales bacterium]|nr:FAD-dependent oxidoreductase [Verrucomicrobiales bacterium]